MTASDQFHVTVSGPGDARPIVFAHGFGCDQQMWRLIAPRFEQTNRVVLYDLAGYGGSAPGSFDADRHVDLDAYADDLEQILEELDLRDVVFVGHSVAAMIGAIAANRGDGRITALAMVSPSPRYINDTGYVGGFERKDIDELLDTMDRNYIGWANFLAPAIMAFTQRAASPESLARLKVVTDILAVPLM